MKRWQAVALKISASALALVGAVYGAIWVRNHTPPAGIRELVAGLNADDAAFADYLNEHGFNLGTGARDLYRLRADGADWRFVKVRKWEQGNPQVILQSREGIDACLLTSYHRGKLQGLIGWRYVKGKTLQEIADSARIRSRAPGIAIALYHRGRETFATSGYADLQTKEPFTLRTRLPISSEYPLILMTLARLAQKGDVPWSTIPSRVLRQYDFPSYAKSWANEHFLFRGTDSQGFPTSAYEPEKYGVVNARKRAIQSSFKEMNAAKGLYVGGGPLMESPDLKVVIEATEATAKEPISDLIVREVFMPLGMTDAGFGKPLATTYELDEPLTKWAKPGYKFGPDEKTPSFKPKESTEPPRKSLISDQSGGMSIRDYLQLGKFRLESAKGSHKYLNLEQQERLKTKTSPYADDVWQFGFQRGGRGWSFGGLDWGSSVGIWVLPEQDTIIVVVANLQLRPMDFMGPILWRVAEGPAGLKLD